ncbi:TniQ family protein [Pseudoalteromonas pernae]|uniref:TniQ family protein n=1 Tax=Pseudoalteromonas pernae TaxID=3118054 RepID=UPI003242D724
MMTNTFFPVLQPDEHVLSMFVRRLHLNACRDIKVEQRVLSGKAESLLVGPIEHSALLTVLNTIEDPVERERVLREHTLCGFYSHSLRQKWIRSFLSPIRVKRNKELFIPHASKLRSTGSWRWCNECVKQDKEVYGLSYWHVEHQLPTSVTCSKHVNKELVSQCQSCGFIVRDLRNTPYPETQCSECECDIIHRNEPISSDLLWLQEQGLALHRNCSSLYKSSYSHDMNYEVSLRVSKLIEFKGQELWRVQEKLQPIFSEWANDIGADTLFIDGFSFEDDIAVSLSNTILKNRKVSPLSHLLWLRFLGAESIRAFQ